MASIISYTKAALDSLLALKADSSHLHDDRYFTETEVTNALSGKSDSAHIHDDRYFTETELNTSLAAKVSKAGDTMTGQLLLENASVRAGTLTDVLGTALEIIRNNIQIGRIDNNAGGLRIQAQAGVLQLRGSGNTGIAIDSAGVADFAVAPTIAGSAFPGGSPSPPFRVGKTYLLSISNNGTALFGATLGTEYSIGVYLPAGTYDRIGLTVGAAGDAGSVLRIGLRPIGSSGTPGAAAIDAAVAISAIGDPYATFTGVALAAGWYALSWTRIGDAGGLSRLQRSPIEMNPNLYPINAGTANPATGHGPRIATLNTGITGALPSTVVMADIGTNLEGGSVPLISIRRSA